MATAVAMARISHFGTVAAVATVAHGLLSPRITCPRAQFSTRSRTPASSVAPTSVQAKRRTLRRYAAAATYRHHQLAVTT